MKKLIVLLFCFLLVFSLCACEDSVGMDTEKELTHIEQPQTTDSMFVVVEQIQDTDYACPFYIIVYHKETKVMYAISRGSENRGIFTVLINADGSPMIWEGK